MSVDIVTDLCWGFEQRPSIRVLRAGVDFGDRYRTPSCNLSVLLNDFYSVLTR